MPPRPSFDKKFIELDRYATTLAVGDNMKFHTPPRNQGQMVEVSYASDDEGAGIFMRVFDKSDGEEKFFFLSWDDFYDLGNDASDFEPWNDEPDVPYRAWKKVRAPRMASNRTLTASDRRSLIRLASTMPVGSPERRAILAGLSKSAGLPKSPSDAWDTYVGSQDVSDFMAGEDDAEDAVAAYAKGHEFFSDLSKSDAEKVKGMLVKFIEQNHKA